MAEQLETSPELEVQGGAISRNGATHAEERGSTPSDSPPDEGPAHPRLPGNLKTPGFAPTLLSAFVFFLSLAVLVAIALYLLAELDPATVAQNPAGVDGFSAWWSEWKGMAAPILSVVLAFAACGLFAHFHSAYMLPERVDSQIYGELRTRLNGLDAQLNALCPRPGPEICDEPLKFACVASCDEAWARRDFVVGELGSRGARWVLGSGFVDIYRHLHAAEEALYLVQPVSSLVSSAFYDDLRLMGADKAIPNAPTMRANLRRAVVLLGGSGADFLSSDGPNGTPAPAPADLPADPALGRVILREIRRAISEFRDDERAKLVRARNQLISTGTITAVWGYALLALAMLIGAKPEHVVTGVVYYVVGAAIGLFSQLRDDRENQAEEEDFGFSRARLFYVPVLSGLAAVGGVTVVTLLAESVNFLGDSTQRTLDGAFSIKEFGGGLVIAAVFGLTPSLLIERLQAKADVYRTALKLTSPTA